MWTLPKNLLKFAFVKIHEKSWFSVFSRKAVRTVSVTGSTPVDLLGADLIHPLDEYLNSVVVLELIN